MAVMRLHFTGRDEPCPSLRMVCLWPAAARDGEMLFSRLAIWLMRPARGFDGGLLQGQVCL